MSRRRHAQTVAAEPAIQRCAIYTRKSTSAGLEQEFNTLHAQREACEHYIANHAALGWQLLPARYDDGGFTGANLERPAFQSLMEDIDAGKIDIVVVYKVDRLSRSLLDFARVMEHFHRAGVAFVSVTQNFSTADAMGRLTLNMLMSFAEFEREMIAERTRDKMAAARRKGRWTGGVVPLGYDVVDKKLVINELEAVVVKEVFDLYEQHLSALDVARILNERGRTTKPRRQGDGSVRKGGEWSKMAVLRTLRNPIYAGFIPSGGEVYEGEHEAIISREHQARIKALLAANSHARKSRGRNPAYILRGIVRCKRCGGAMTPASNRRNGRVYRYYRCVTRDHKGSKACLTRPLPAEELEAFVIDNIREATADRALADDVARQFDKRIRAQRQALAGEKRGLPDMIASLSADAESLTDRLSKSTGAVRRRLEERLDEVSAELSRRTGRLEAVERALVLLEQHRVEAEWVIGVLTNFDAVWEAMNLENRGRLVRAVIERVEIDEPRGEISVVITDMGLGESVDEAARENDTTTETIA